METKEAIQLGLTILTVFVAFIGGIITTVWKISKLASNVPKELTEYFNKAIRELSESIDKNVKALNDHGEQLSKQVAVMNNTIEKTITMRLDVMETNLKETNLEVKDLHFKLVAIDTKFFNKYLSKE